MVQTIPKLHGSRQAKGHDASRRARGAGLLGGCRVVVGPIIATLAFGCAVERQPESETDAATREIGRELDIASACLTCITLTPGTVLGDLSGPGYVVHTEHAVRDASGRYWLGQYRDMIKVFAADGQFLATVGREGEGPEEFGMPLPIKGLPDGRVLVLDQVNMRVSTWGEALDFRAAERLPMVARRALPLPDGAFAVNAPVQTPEALGHPLHIVRGGEITRSFGAETHGITNPLSVQRVIAVDHSGRLVSSTRDRVALTTWTTEGELVSSLLGPDLREADPPIDRRVQRGAAETTLMDMWFDDQGLLWLLILGPAPDWREHMNEVPVRGGGIALEPKNDDVSPIYHSHLWVVDAAAGKVVARATEAVLFLSHIGGEEFLQAVQTDAGVPQLVSWTARYDARPSPN